jgi:hypothetical protein
MEVKMRILVAGSIQADNGYEEEQLVKSIVKYLADKNHIVDSFMLPFSRDMLSLPDQIIAYQMFDLSSAELLITVGYPACMLSHNNKIIYLLETTPMLNEYWNSEYGVLENYQYEGIRKTVYSIEENSFKTATKVFCNSKTLSNDLAERYKIEPMTLYSPNIFKVEEGVIEEQGAYFVTETSLLPYQRIELLLDTIKDLSESKLYLYIPRSNQVYYDTLIKQIEERNLSEYINVRHGAVPNNLLKGAKAYIATDYQVRKIPAGIIRSSLLDINIIACDDSGAIAEYIQVHKRGIIEKAKASLLSKKIHGITTKKKMTSETVVDCTNTFMRGLTTI